MELVIEESENERLFFNEGINLSISNYSKLRDIKNIEDIFKYLIFHDEMFTLFNIDEEHLNTIYLYVINKISHKKLKKKFEKDSLLIFTMIDNQVNNYHNKYNRILNQNITDTKIRCNKHNLLKVLSLHLSNITIESDNITFNDYYNLLSRINLKKYDDKDIKIKIKESSSPMTLSKLYSIVNITKESSDKIKGMNLSNLEKVLYVYDIVKRRIYNENNGDCRSSRDIDKVILGNNIVCVGYANLMSTILSFFDINATMIISEKESHAICLAYIKDDKYNIDGFLTFDATNDSRIDEKDKEYIHRYNYFAFSLSHVFNSFPIENIEEINIPLKELAVKINNPENEDRYRLLSTIEELFIMTGNENSDDVVSNLISYDLATKKEKIELEKEYKCLMNKLFMTHINMDTFIKALYNTRRIEYYIGVIPEINKEEIRETTINWKISLVKDERKDDDKFMKVLYHVGAFGYLQDNEERLISSSLKDNPSTERDIYNMRLVKVLKKELQRKSN